jgi:hypothetical protein
MPDVMAKRTHCARSVTPNHRNDVLVLTGRHGELS